MVPSGLCVPRPRPADLPLIPGRGYCRLPGERDGSSAATREAGAVAGSALRPISRGSDPGRERPRAPTPAAISPLPRKKVPQARVPSGLFRAPVERIQFPPRAGTVSPRTRSRASPWPAGLLRECPPATACGGALLLDFAAKACRPRRGPSDRSEFPSAHLILRGRWPPQHVASLPTPPRPPANGKLHRRCPRPACEPLSDPDTPLLPPPGIAPTHRSQS